MGEVRERSGWFVVGAKRVWLALPAGEGSAAALRSQSADPQQNIANLG